MNFNRAPVAQPPYAFLSSIPISNYCSAARAAWRSISRRCAQRIRLYKTTRDSGNEDHIGRIAPASSSSPNGEMARESGLIFNYLTRASYPKSVETVLSSTQM